MPTLDKTDTPDASIPGAGKSAKDEVRALLDRLPDDVTLEDIRYHLDVVVKWYEGERSGERDGWFPHEEVERRIAAWFEK